MSGKISKIGDLFFIKIDNFKKKYFQYVCDDSLQLNSNVIRVFHNLYSLNTDTNLNDIVNSQVEFYAHCNIKLGIKLECWEWAGNIENIGNYSEVIFRDTNDYGAIAGRQIDVSNNWYIWKINDLKFTKVGRLNGANLKSEIGIIISPDSIVHRAITGEYDFNYPKFK